MPNDDWLTPNQVALEQIERFMALFSNSRRRGIGTVQMHPRQYQIITGYEPITLDAGAPAVSPHDTHYVINYAPGVTFQPSTETRAGFYGCNGCGADVEPAQVFCPCGERQPLR